jgi:hypothetical protein
MCEVDKSMMKKIVWAKPLLIISTLILVWSVTGCNSENTTKLQTTVGTSPALTQTQTAAPTVTNILHDRVVLAEVFTKEK